MEKPLITIAFTEEEIKLLNDMVDQINVPSAIVEVFVELKRKVKDAQTK